jgi:prevent-host-death family protein
MKTNTALKQVPVSIVKAKLLEIIRSVEHGKGFEITKNGKSVARLLPVDSNLNMPAVGFAKIKILGDIEQPIFNTWTFDEENVKS